MKISKKLHVRRKGPGAGRPRRNPTIRKASKAMIVKDIMQYINQGQTPNANLIAKKYHIPFKELDKILEEYDLDVCNKCYNIHKISWGSLTRAASGLTYCDSCKKKLSRVDPNYF